MAKKKPATRQPTLDDLITGGYRYVAPEEAQPEPEEAKPEKSSLARRALGDTGIALVKGAMAVPEALVGMADMVSGGRAGQLAEEAGFRPKEARAILDQYLSPEQQAANEAVQQAEGFTGKLGAAVTNPSVIWQAAAESAPSMLAGGVVARGAMAAAPTMAKTAAGRMAAVGLGEGAVSAGQTAEQVRQETADGLLTGQQAAIAATSGVLTGALGVIAGRVAQKLGIGDVDAMVAGVKTAGPATQKGVVRSILEGAVSEGVLEELPQSVQEQVAQNLALGKPLEEGVDHAAVLGMLSGGLMGAAAGPLGRGTGTPEGKAIRDEKLPEVGPLTKALNAHTETRAAEADAGKPTLTAEEVTLQAQNRLAELDKKAKGTKDTTHPGPDGKPVTIPGEQPQYLTPEELKERDFLTQNAQNPEALARAAGATISPFMRQPDAAIPGALPPDTAMARMEDMARQQAQADRFASRGEAEAPPPAAATAPQADDANPPPELDDILNPAGEPFKNKTAVNRALKAQANPRDFVVASVAGGYVLRPVKKKEPTDGSVALPAERGLAGGVGVGTADAGGSLAADGRPADVPGAGVPGGTAAADPQAADAGVGAGGNDAAVAADVAGDPIDAEWTAFKPETGTKAVPRADMPQIKAEHRGAMTQFLKGRGIVHEQEADVDPATLKPTQAEFAPGKVQRAREFAEGDRAILVSSDGHILDGHHQWLAAREDGKPIRVIRFDAPIEQLMAQAKEFPSAEAGEGAPAVDREAALDAGIADLNKRVDDMRAAGEATTALAKPQQLFVDGPDGKRYPVADVPEAQRLWVQFRDAAGAGVSEVGNGVRVVDQDGKFVARVSYNGRAWSTEDDATGEGKVIAEAPDSAPAPAPVEPKLDTPAEDSPQARWTRSTEAERLGVLGKAGWSVTPPSLSTQRMLKVSWDKMSDSQRSRIAAAMDSAAPAPAAAPAEPATATHVQSPAIKPPSKGNEPRIRSNEADGRWPYPVEFKGVEPAAVQARRDVVDYMNGDIDKATLIQKLADSGLGEGQVWNATNRLGDDFVQADMNDVEAIREGKKPSRKNPIGYDATNAPTTQAPQAPSREEAPAARSDGAGTGQPAGAGAAAPAQAAGVTPSAGDSSPKSGEAMHADPGEPAEPATPAVVKKAIQTAARNDGRPIKDVKAEALRLIDEAIANAKDESDPDVQMFAERSRVKVDKKALDRRGLIGKQRELAEADIQRKIDAERNKAADNIGYVTISVPGDGEFKVLNTKERLAEFRRKVENSPGLKTQRPGPVDSPRVNSRYGEAYGVEDGSGSKANAFANMIDDGDIQAALDYAEAVGIDPAKAKLTDTLRQRLDKWQRDRKYATHDEDSDRTLTMEYGGSMLGLPLDQPAWATTDEQLREAIAKAKYSAGNFALWQIERDKVLRQALADGKPVPVEVKYDRLPELRRDFKSEDDLDEALDAATSVYNRTKDAQAAVDAFMAWRKEAPASAPAPQPQPEKAEKPASKSERLTDAGEELIRNRRGKLKGLAWDDVSAMNDTLKVAQVVKGNVWPRPDYAKMVEDGAPAWKAAALKAVYDKLAAAPVTRAAPTDDDLRAYIETMQAVREALTAELDRVAALPDGAELWKSIKAANVFGKVFPVPSDAKPLYGSPSPFDRRSEQGKENNRRALMIGGNNAVQALQFGYKTLGKIKDLLADGFPAKQEAWQKSYEVRPLETRNSDVPEAERTGNTQERFFVYEKGSRWRLASPKEQQEGGYASQELAEAFARSLTVKKREVLPPSRGLDLADAKRTGPDWRGGKDVTAEQVMSHFGFRGVNLGEYVKAKQEVAQAHLNHVYDAFSDLADLMGVPPKAMSLNGTLGVAIGAQGSGKALAHFVPGVNEINITRDSGAGALAHEFGHAIDHYFATQQGKATAMAKRPYLSAVVKTLTDAGGVRPEVIEAMRAVVNTMDRRPMTEAEAKQYMADQRKLNEARMDRWIAELKGNRGADKAALDAVGAKLKRGELGEKTGDGLESSIEELVRASGLKPGNLTLGQPIGIAYRLASLADEATFLAKHIPQVDTNYAKASDAMDAKKRDGDGYWSTPWEKFARAFETFVMDALRDRQRESLYLSGLVDGAGWNAWAEASGKTIPYPAGDERLAMQQAFQTLVDTIQTREDEAGNVAMFSRATASFEADVDSALDDTSDANVLRKHARVSDETPEVLRLLGIEPKPVVTSLALLRKMHDDHGVPASVLKRLPELISDPVLVLRSRTQDGRMVIVTDELIGGRPLVLVIDPSGESGNVQVVFVPSAYPKDGGPDVFVRDIKGGGVLYANKAKSRLLATTAGLQLPGVVQRAVGFSVREYATEADLPQRDTPAASRGTGGQNNAARLQVLIDVVSANWENAPPIVVAQNMQDPKVPQEARDEDAKQRSQGATGVPEGFYYKGKVYILADGIAGSRDALRVMFHETLGHHGLRGTFGRELGTILDRIAVLNQGKVRAKAKEYGLDYDKPSERRQAAEEVLAEMAQTNPELGWVQRTIAAIRSFLRRVVPGFQGMKFSDAEIIRDFILPARAWVEGRDGITFSVGSMEPAFARAFHGTPYRGIERFDTSKIGTGEGAQAYGWGLYFASKKEVAEHYRKTLAGATFDYADDAARAEARRLTNFDDWVWRWLGDTAEDAGYDPAKMVAAIERYTERYSGSRDTLRAIGAMLADGRLIPRRAGQVYEVRVPEDDELLLWDKPLGEQPAKVRAAMQPLLDRLEADSRRTMSAFSQQEVDREIAASRKTMTGEGFYNLVSNLMNDDWRGSAGNDEAASKTLLAAGIKGIKYLDGMSRDGKSGSFNYVVFDGADAQIEGVMFSRASEAIDTLRSAATAKGLADIAADLMQSDRSFNWWHRTIGTQYQKAKDNADFGAVYDAAQTYLHDTSAFANDAAALAPDVVPQLKGWKDAFKPLRLSDEDQNALASIVFKGTLDDKRVYTDEELRTEFKATDRQIELYRQFRAAVDRSLDTLVATDVARFIGRDMPAPLKAMISNGDLGRFRGLVTAFAQQKKDEASKALAAVKKANRKKLSAMWDEQKKRLEGTKPGSRLAIEQELEDSQARIREEVRRDEKAAADELAKWTAFERTTRDKYDRIDQLQEEGYAPLMRFGQYTVYVTSQEGEQEFFGLYESQADANRAARQFRESEDFKGSNVVTGVLSQEAYKQFSGMSPETLELFGEVSGVEKTPLFEQYLRLTKSNRSALKRLISRKGIAGYSEDTQRVLASFLTSNARASSGNLHLGDMARLVEEIPKERGDVKDEAIKLQQYVQNPTEEAQRLRGLLFVQYLGGSIASALVNMTQPFMMTFPYLSQFGGAGKAAVRLGEAMKAALTKPDGELGRALAKAEKEGIVSPQELHQLQAEASRTMGNHPGVRRLLFTWGAAFSLAEQFNRRVSFIAAWNTAKAQGIANPFQFAAKAVDETQGVYNRGNRPNWARGAVGATLFTFKQYSISYIEFLKRLPNKERAIALMVLMLAAGAEGLPFAEDLTDLIDTIGQALGYDTNSKAWRNQVMADAIGDEAADFALHGFSAMPGFPLDVSGRLALSNLIPGTGILLKHKTDKSGEVFDVLGPAGGMVRDALKGEFRPLAIRNLDKGLQMYQTGEYRDTRDRRVVDVDGLESAVKAIGFQPADVARESRKIQLTNQQVQLARAVEGEIASEWAQGIADKEPEKVRKAKQRLDEWNRDNPRSRIAINTGQLQRRVRELRMTRQERFQKTIPREMRSTTE